MKKSELGQALVIILLVMAVGLTMGLAVVSRSVTDIRISQQEEESARAFSAAEAGIEEAMISGPGDYTVGVDEGTITARVEQDLLGEGNEYDLGGGKFKSGDTQTVWLIGHTEDEDFDSDVTFPIDGTINVCWGDSGDINAQTPALEASLVYQVGLEFRVARLTYDPYGGRRVSNGFGSPDAGGCLGLAFKKAITLTDFGDLSGATLYALRLKLLYNEDPQPIKISSASGFPSQGKCYISTATIVESGVTRKVKQCQTYKAPPGVFDYVLFSGEDLVK
jgi:hypothetical protein